jgi:aminopeptidase
MTDPRLKRMARVLTEYALGLKPGDLFLIQSSDLAAPLIREVFYEALLAGAHPYVKVTPEGIAEILYKNASEEQLQFVSDVQQLEVEKINAALTILGSHNSRSLAGVDPQRVALQKQAGLPLTKRILERIGAGDLRWCTTSFPTQAAAQDAGMSLSDYEEFLFSACGLDQDDPLVHWRNLAQNQERWIEFLSGIKTLRITAADTDLTFSVEGRGWVNAAGQENFPDGEIFTAPLEDSMEGHIRFSFPVVNQGREAEEVRLVFEKGQVVKAQAVRGMDLVKAMLQADEGAAFVGKFAFGTNAGLHRFTRNPLFDLKMGGTIHLGLGASSPGTGGQNQSAYHWDMICDLRPGGEIAADGEVFYRDGKFLI